jgi:hypothetical protein
VKPQSWPETAEELLAIQSELARATPAPWDIEREPLVGASFVCSVRGKRGAGQAGDPAWAAAALSDERSRSPRAAPGHRTSRGCSRYVKGLCSSQPSERCRSRPRC